MNFRKYSKYTYIYILIMLVVGVLWCFGVQWKGNSIITENIVFNNTFTNAITSKITEIVGNERFSQFIVFEWSSILTYFVCFLLPMRLIVMVKGVFANDK